MPMYHLHCDMSMESKNMPNHTQEKIDNEKHRILLKRNKLTLLRRKEFILLPHMKKKKMRKKHYKLHMGISQKDIIYIFLNI